jgi:hypothetical protein
VDVGSLWAESGVQWLTAPGVGVPAELVRTVTGIVSFLDLQGAGLATSVAAAGVGLLSERAALLGLPPSGTTSCGGATRLLECADGWVAVSLARPDDVRSIPAWLGVSAAEDDHWTALEGALAAEECHAVTERGIELGIACATAGEQTDRRPVLVDHRGAAPARSVRGAIVVNLASLWAGPLAADTLARLGARVINVESTSRPDGARQTPAFFETLHGLSESVALDLRTDVGHAQLRRLLAVADVVIEGSRPRALRQMGIDAGELVGGGSEAGPTVWVSITGHGRDGSQGNRVGFGDDAAVAGGLHGLLAGAPNFLGDALADPIAGLTAAATVDQVLDGGGRWVIDIALSRVAASVAQPPEAMTPAASAPLPPRPRRDVGRPLPIGCDTAAVLTEFGIAGPGVLEPS